MTHPLPPPVRVADVPKAVQDMIAPVDLGGEVEVFTDLNRLEDPYAAREARVGVFLPHRVYSPASPWRPRYNPFRQQAVRVAVVAGVSDDPLGALGFDFLGRLHGLHDALHEALHWQAPAVANHEVVLPLLFCGYVQDTAQYSAGAASWFMSAEYKTILRRVAA